MKILYIVSRPVEINTSASIRNLATILGLIENGNELTVISAVPDTNHPSYDDSITLEGVAHTHYIKVGGTQNIAKFTRSISFLSPIRTFAYKIIRRHEIYDNLKVLAERIAEEKIDIGSYDYIISSSDPKSSHLCAYNLITSGKQSFNGKWIQIWGDPFLGDITANYSKSITKKIRIEEEKLLNKADSIIYVSEMTRRQQAKLYKQFAHKMTTLPIPYLNKKESIVNDKKISKTVKLSYCGDYISKVRNIMPLYSAVHNEDNIILTIAGMSDLKLETDSRIQVFSRVSKIKVDEVEQNADILIHLSNIKGSQIPGKIYQYSGTDKPILFILDGDKRRLRDQFEKYNRYVFCDNSEEAILYSIKKIISENKHYIPLSAFSRTEVAKRIIESCED